VDRGRLIDMGRVRSVTQLSTFDVGGGAEKVARMLFEDYRRRGLVSKLVVGYRRLDDPDVVLLQRTRTQNAWARTTLGLARALKPAVGRLPGAGRTHLLLCHLSEPELFMQNRLGLEDFHHPQTATLFGRIGRPDILHAHNLHGGYFDLRRLPEISRQVATVMTLHDAWLTTGHCAHSFDCDRWITGCGECPDLSIYPAIERDATAFNWRRKRNIYRQSRLHVATPSRWLMAKVERSILMHGIRSRRVIPNGVDIGLFRPGDKIAARRRLGLPDEPFILLFAANSIRNNIWRDYHCLRDALARLPALTARNDFLMLGLGETAPDERVGTALLRFVPYQADPEVVATYYRAADAYVHPAKVDTFPNVVLEALASGVPVVATAVGGIPEQVCALDHPSAPTSVERKGPDQATGLLVAAGDAAGMANAVAVLANDAKLASALGTNASRDAAARFAQALQTDAYLAWYDEIFVGDAVKSA
jgi:glycosyltransferase involved in cell wall biosynthesis